MATRSTIAVQLADGSIRQVYSHWDGYLEHNGQILFKYYNSQALAELVTSGGAISVLEPRFTPTGEHSFGAPQDGVTVLYARDRGEDLQQGVYVDYDAYVSQGQQEEFNYLFIDGHWEVNGGSRWLGLETALSANKEPAW